MQDPPRHAEKGQPIRARWLLWLARTIVLVGLSPWVIRGLTPGTIGLIDMIKR